MTFIRGCSATYHIYHSEKSCLCRQFYYNKSENKYKGNKEKLDSKLRKRVKVKKGGKGLCGPKRSM